MEDAKRKTEIFIHEREMIAKKAASKKTKFKDLFTKEYSNKFIMALILNAAF